MADESQLPQEWTIKTIDSLGRVLTGKTPSTKIDDNFGGNIPFITPSDMDGRRIIAHTARYLTEQGAASVSSARIPRGAVMVSCIGSDMGKAAIAGCDAVTNQQINSIIVGEGISNLYVYYNLSMRKSEIQHIGSGGSAVPILNKGHFSQLQIALPPLKEQQAIACILGALDDKIELNRRMNETLEAMARAIFKSWFVDFDPVRAKANLARRSPKANAVGRKPLGLAPHIAKLFPDSFVESELGEIPKGWEVGMVGALADVSSGKRPDVRFEEASPRGAVPLWGGNGPMAFVARPLIDWPILLTGRVGTLGSVFRITAPCWPSDNTLILKAKNERAFEYLFLQLKRIDFGSLNRGSTQPLLTQTDLKSQPVLLPSASILDHFRTVANEIYSKIDSVEYESRTLASLRDALLPRLISGELRVRDAERIVGRAL